MSLTDNASPPPRSPFARARPWLIGALLLLFAWLLVSLALAGWHAKKAQSALTTMSEQLASDNRSGVAASIQAARSETLATRSAITTLPIAALGLIPWFHTNLNGADAILGSVLHVVDASEVANDLYPVLSGFDERGQPVVNNGRVNIRALERTAPDVTSASASLTEAERLLAAVPHNVTPPLRDLVTETQPDVQRLAKALRIADEVLPELPVLLGKDRPARYLVVFNNPAELYAGGGAALSAALVQFDDGRMTVLQRGELSRFFPNYRRVPWNPVADGPYYADRGAKDAFAWSNLHQDFRIAGEDMLRSWRAQGGTPVDGVISLDPVALQAAIAVTGPVNSAVFGRITADNLVQKVLIDAYAVDAAGQGTRRAANSQLIDEMLSRMQDGETALIVAKAMLPTAVGQHVRIHLARNKLADLLNRAGLDGAQPAPEPDQIAFFTQNQNSSKIDVFQTRRILQRVRLQADGSAEVRQRVMVSTKAGGQGDGTGPRTGYTTRWAFHWNVVFLPEGAQDVRIRANKGGVKVDPRVFADVDGRQAVRIGRWIPPGGSSRITTTYRLPPGTFGGEGRLEYRVGVEHQLLLNSAELTIRVTGPSPPTPTEGDWVVVGDSAEARLVLTQPTVLALRFLSGDN